VTTTEPVLGGANVDVVGTTTAPLALVGGAPVVGVVAGRAAGAAAAGAALGRAALAGPAAGLGAAGLGVLPIADVGRAVEGVDAVGVTGAAAGRAGLSAGFAAAPLAGRDASAVLSSPTRREYPGGSGGSRRGGGGESLLFDTVRTAFRRADARLGLVAQVPHDSDHARHRAATKLRGRASFTRAPATNEHARVRAGRSAPERVHDLDREQPGERRHEQAGQQSIFERLGTAERRVGDARQRSRHRPTRRDHLCTRTTHPTL
jgi:hypothetical protein